MNDDYNIIFLFHAPNKILCPLIIIPTSTCYKVHLHCYHGYPHIPKLIIKSTFTCHAYESKRLSLIVNSCFIKRKSL